MTSPTIADAIALLRDSSLRAEPEDRRDGFVRMRGTEIIDRLAGPDDDRVNARTLVAEALTEIGGLDRSHWPERSGRGRGRGDRQQDFIEDFWTPESALDDGRDR